MSDERYRIFLSAVSSEFEAARNAVAAKLRARGLTVKVQSDFRQEHDTASTLEKLHNYIRDCHAVIAIAGKRSGSSPPPVAAEPYSAMAPPEFAAASYTQWEVFFALHYKKSLSVYFANNSFAPHRPDAPDEDDPASQLRFATYLKNHLGRDYNEFGTVAELLAEVLSMDWPTLSVTKPRKLPYDSLGELFMGREPFLKDLQTRFADARKRNHWPKHAVCGLGGVGKTRLAVEYAWRCADDYSALLLVNAESAESLERELKNLAGVLYTNLDPATPDPDRLRLTCEWLDRNPGWLLVLDNVDTEQALEAVTKRFAEWSHGHVLVTGRVTQWPRGVEPLDLHVLSPNDARDFLLRATEGRRHATAEDETEAASLAKDELDCLCLALEQSAAYIGERQLTFAEYRERWRENEKNVRAWANKTLMHYHEDSPVSLSIATTWQTTFDVLSPPARTLLEMLSFLAPDPLPRGLLENAEMEQQLRNACVDENAEVEIALAELRRYSLLRRPEHLPDHALGQVHRLVQLITRDRLANGARRKIVQATADAVNEYTPERSSDVRTWPILLPLEPHLLAITSNADSEGIAAPTARLLNQLATFAFERAAYFAAGSLMRRALEIDERSFGMHHPNVAICLNNFAQLLQATNRLAEAEPLMRRALVIDERSFGKDHPKVAIRLNNLASLLQATNRLAEAEPLMRQALDIDERSFGKDHPDVAIDLSNLASLLQATNRLTEAEPLMRRALEIDERSFGQDHPDVARDLNNLASLLQDTNRLAEAEPLMRQALEIDERSFGKDHPDVARDLNNLASLLQVTNRLAEAEPLMRRALDIDERSLGKDHPNVAIRLNNLAQLLDATNRLAEAEPLMRRALDIDERSFGKDHPNVAIDLSNLAQLLQATNRLTEAEPLMRRALVIFETSLGSDHPSTKTVARNLRALLAAMRDAAPG